MMRTIDLALKDIRQILRDRQSLLFLIVMPVIFTFFFGFMFTPAQSDSDGRLPLGIFNQDEDGLLTAPLQDLLEASPTVRPVLIAAADAGKLDEQVLKGELAGAIIIPAGYSEAALGDNPVAAQIIVDELSQNGQTVRRALQTNLTRLLGLAHSAHYSLATYEQQNPALSAAERSAYLQDAVQRGLQGWLNPSLTVTVSGPAASAADDQFGGNAYNQFSPGMLVQFAIFGLVQAAMVLVIERRSGAMQRLLTTPLTRGGLIAGHLLAIFTVVLVQQVVLIAFGQAVLKVDYLRQPLAVALVMVMMSLFVASLGLLIATLAKKEEQVIVITMAAMFIFSALGGTWFSLEVAGPTFAAIGRLTPAAWAMIGFQNIILRGLDFSSVLLPSGILLAYSAACFGLAVWRFKFE